MKATHGENGKRTRGVVPDNRRGKMSRRTVRRHPGLEYESADDPGRAKALLASWVVAGTPAFCALGVLSPFDLARCEALVPPAVTAASVAVVRWEY